MYRIDGDCSNAFTSPEQIMAKLQELHQHGEIQIIRVVGSNPSLSSRMREAWKSLCDMRLEKKRAKLRALNEVVSAAAPPHRVTEGPATQRGLFGLALK
jgi:uncharacterized Fe-S cluster-containing radical SAM superfamily protein